VEEYGVYLWDAAVKVIQSKKVCATCFSATFTGVPNGSSYIITVYGRNATGWGAGGQWAWTLVATKPGAPTAVRMTAGNAQVTATWSLSTTPGSAIDGYWMYPYDANGYTGKSAFVCATCTTATVGGLTNGRSYYALVYAHNALGWGDPATSASVVVGTPGSATDVVATAGVGSVGVTWGAAPNSGSTIDSYGVFAFDSNGYLINYVTVCGTCTTGTVSGLVAGMTYTMWIFPHNAMGWGTPAAAKPVTVR